MLKKILRLYYTVKPLRYRQVYYRIRYRLFPLTQVKLSSNSHFAGSWVWCGLETKKPSIISNNEVTFLGRQANITSSSVWNNPSHEKLWLYNIHYFDDLNAIDFKNRKSWHITLIDRWINENPACSGNGWEPYPLSLRLINWVKWFSRYSSVDAKYLVSIAEQAEALTKQLEYHILGNHLFTNAKALTFVGCYFNDETANRYLDIGLEVLDEEIQEQFLADGAHFELSPMYHEILLWDLLELINLANTSQNEKLLSRKSLWKTYAQRGLAWLQAMLHSDGEISFFNDAAIGIAANPKEIFEYATKLGITWRKSENRLTTNRVSGYSCIEYPGYKLIFDHASVGPDYLPGHAHADTLSFELSVGLQRVFVNSGTSLYGVSDERLRQRQTAAHNTVTVDEQDSSEVWSGFRVARRAFATLLNATSTGNSVRLVASHDGYKRLKKPTVHQRTITATNNVITIKDELSGIRNGVYHLHLHPNVVIQTIDEHTLHLCLTDGQTIEFSSIEAITIRDSTWHPNFGSTRQNKKIAIPFSDGNLSTQITIMKTQP